MLLNKNLKLFLLAKKSFSILPLLILCSLQAAQIDALDLMDKTVGLRHIGTGFAGIAAIDPTYASHWNPASIIYAEKHSLAISYDQHFDVSVLSGDSVYMYEKNIPLGFSVIQSSVADIPRTEDHGDIPIKTGTFSDDYRMFGLTMGTRFANMAFGITTKYLSRSLGAYAADGFGLDLGTRLELSSQVALGIVYRNAISDIVWSTGASEALEKKLGLGLTILDTLGELPLAIHADYDIGINSIENFWAVGGEIWLMPKILALRLGTNGHKDLTFGLGVCNNDFFSDIAVVFKDEKTNLSNYVLFSAGMIFTPQTHKNTGPYPAPTL